MNYPNTEYEQNLWSRGNLLVAGLDEVGRGAFAGPVVVGCVAFPPNFNISKVPVYINDSKKMSAKLRLLASDWIKNNALVWSVGEASVASINKLGIGKAANMAFRKAIAGSCRLSKEAVNHILIDAFLIPKVKGFPVKTKQTSIVRGDQISFSIASASILAKVYRDNIMESLALRVPDYNWHQNKGYGTKVHRDLIVKNGITRHHRIQFIKTWQSKQKTSV